MCGRPSARTVAIQNSSAASSALRVSSQLVAVVPGSLKIVSSLVVGVVMICSRLCPELHIGTDDINAFIFGLVSHKHRSVDEVRSVRALLSPCPGRIAAGVTAV